MHARLESALTGTLLLCAIGVSGSYVYNTFGNAAGGTTIAEASVPFAAWDEALQIGHTVSGDSTAATTLILFADFQCPACRGYHERVVKPAIDKHGQTLQVLYVPFPLDYHEHAMPAARATECVSETVQWNRWIDQLYAQQDSLGRKPWAHLAHEAGVVDTAAITACVEGSATFPRIDEGLRLAKAAALRGTPSVILNGRLFSALPTPAVIDSVVARGGQRSR